MDRPDREFKTFEGYGYSTVYVLPQADIDPAVLREVAQRIEDRMMRQAFPSLYAPPADTRPKSPSCGCRGFFHTCGMMT